MRLFCVHALWMTVALGGCSLVYGRSPHVDDNQGDPRQGMACIPGEHSCGAGLQCRAPENVCDRCFGEVGAESRVLPVESSPVENLNLSPGNIGPVGTHTAWLTYRQAGRAVIAVADLSDQGALNGSFAQVSVDGISHIMQVESIDFCHAAKGDYVALVGASGTVELIELPADRGGSATLVDSTTVENAWGAAFVGCDANANPDYGTVKPEIYVLTRDPAIEPIVIDRSSPGLELVGLIRDPRSVVRLDGIEAGRGHWTSDRRTHVWIDTATETGLMLTRYGEGNAFARMPVVQQNHSGAPSAVGKAPDLDMVLAWPHADGYTALQRFQCIDGGSCDTGTWAPALTRTGFGFDRVRAVAFTSSNDGALTMVSIESRPDLDVIAIRLLRDNAAPAHIPIWGTVVLDPHPTDEDLAASPRLGDAIAAARIAHNVPGDADTLLVAYSQLVTGTGESATRTVNVRTFEACGTGPEIEPWP